MDEGVLRVRSVIAPDSPALPAFDHLMAHAAAAPFLLVPRVGGAIQSVELQFTDRRRNPFSVQVRPDYINFYLRSPALDAHDGLFAAAVHRFGPVPPNHLGEYRTHLHTVSEVDDMLAFLRERGAWPAHRHARRFLGETFRPVTAEHLLGAARRLARGFDEHPFGPSTDYDLLFEGSRLPPKAVFGLAASEALGFPVRPENFSAGEGTVAFRTLRAHGYPIVPKDGRAGEEALLAIDEDGVWAEGSPRLVIHLRRERGAGLASAKREDFKAHHGKLFCE